MPIPQMTWSRLQQESQRILASGIYKLVKVPVPMRQRDITCINAGNYFIHGGGNTYIGEANNLKIRVRQQFSLSTSNYYKNYFNTIVSKNDTFKMSISDFKINTMTTYIGRKEIEEYGIVNIPTTLNKFQLEKRSKSNINIHNGPWDNVQENAGIYLKQGVDIVTKQKYIPWNKFDGISVPGIYIVKSTKKDIIYVGESSDIGERHCTHSGRTYFSALRRHIGTMILKFKLKEINGKRRYFSVKEDQAVDKYLNSCSAIFYEAQFGRYELEELLIRIYKPLLNRKGNIN